MITMLDYFCEQVSCPEIPTICAKLGNLKKRITLGDYTTPKKEFDECQCLFDAIQQRAITSKNEPLANAQFVYKSYFQVFCIIITRPQKGEARHPCDDDCNKNVRMAQQEMTLSGLPAFQMRIDGIVCLRQIHQKRTAPI